LIFKFALEYAIRRVQVNHDGLKLKNGTYQVLVYVDDVDTRILGGSVHTIKKNSESLLVVSKEIGLEMNADKTKYMVMSRDQNAGRSHDISILCKGGRVQILGNKLNGSKFYSGRN
jgi:hypothetical protein